MAISAWSSNHRNTPPAVKDRRLDCDVDLVAQWIGHSASKRRVASSIPAGDTEKTAPREPRGRQPKLFTKQDRARRLVVANQFIVIRVGYRLTGNPRVSLPHNPLHSRLILEMDQGIARSPVPSAGAGGTVLYPLVTRSIRSTTVVSAVLAS